MPTAFRVVTPYTFDQAIFDQEIDENLRRVYQARLQERIPDRFSDLLEQLRKRES